ncbi:MAG: 30S ribosome-binding factor RbfA [Bdellovibrionales bacterium]
MAGLGVSRIERVEKELKQLLSSYFLRTLNSYFDGIVTVTTLKITKDLRNANVYISSMTDNPDNENLKVLKHNQSEIQRYIGKNLRTKYVPKLQFFNDDTYTENVRIMGRLKDLGYDTRAEDFID